MYLEKRGPNQKWIAFHDVPANARAALGRKRFAKSLGTKDLAEAKVRAAAYEAKWRMAIEGVRKVNNPEADALWWRNALKQPAQSNEYTDNIAFDLMLEAAHDAAGEVLGDPKAEGNPEVQRYVAIATGDLVKLTEHLDDYLATLKDKREDKTVAMRRATITKFAIAHPYVADVTRKAVQQWINDQARHKMAVATIQRAASEMRGYWRYLVTLELAPAETRPFDGLSFEAAPKSSKQDDRKPFKDEDVVKLWKEAKARDDQSLADLIEIDMWTGCRIEEICAAKIAKVDQKDHYLEIEDAKTTAGWRIIPIHPKLKRTIKRLVKDSTDGYLLSGLTKNKYGDRSNAIGKRFGRLKAELGFGEQFVFHSIRKTVATQFEQASVLENVAADILGHEKAATMSYGVYSGGTSLAQKRAAIAKLSYPPLADG